MFISKTKLKYITIKGSVCVCVCVCEELQNMSVDLFSNAFTFRTCDYRYMKLNVLHLS